MIIINERPQEQLTEVANSVPMVVDFRQVVDQKQIGTLLLLRLSERSVSSVFPGQTVRRTICISFDHVNNNCRIETKVLIKLLYKKKTVQTKRVRNPSN